MATTPSPALTVATCWSGAAATTRFGLDGRDVLNGGPGADTLQGGADNDLYIYIDATDTVVEQPGAGNDTVWTREVSFTLGPNLENLLLVEGTAARDGIGNALDNVITGNAAHNGSSAATATTP